ncbi:MAG: hypothetical protein RL701_2521 [Pseudomonadota bacterium]
MPHNFPHDKVGDAAALSPADCSAELDALFEAAIDDSSFERALELLTQLVASPHVLLGHIDEYGELMILHELATASSRAAERALTVPSALHALGFAPEEWHGAWGSALTSRAVRIGNEPQRQGPECFHCQRELAAPICFDNQLLGLVYASDKTDDYSAHDATAIAQFAKRIGAVLAYRLTQRRFRRELAAAEEMASAAAEGERFFMLSRDPMIISDASIRRSNAAFTSLVGFSGQELRGMSLSDLTLSKDRQLLERELEQLRTEPNREHPAVAVEMLTKGGEQRRVEWVGAATEDGRVYAVGRDITLLSQAMENLEITNAELQRLNADARAEGQLAARLLAHVRRQGCLDSAGIQYVASPLGFFNGDSALANVTPRGELWWMLGDFTGHGLNAAICTVPLAGAFHMSCRNNVSFSQTIAVINDTLKGLLPTGLFCSAALLRLNPEANELSIWNCGLPPVLLRRLSDDTLHTFESQSLPLGLVDSRELQIEPTRISVDVGDDVFVFSDGLTESSDSAGRHFGVDGVKTAVKAARATGEGFNAIMNRVALFRGGQHVNDDLSLVCVSVGHTQVNARGNRETQELANSTESSPR